MRVTSRASAPAPDFRSWLAHFRANERDEPVIPWSAEPLLAPAEADLIRASVATFQLGEHSEGRSLLSFARAHADRMGDDTLVEITTLFVREEQRHAALLREFMRRSGLPRLRREWSDSVFRCLRKQAGLRLSLCVLVTAELISLVYYDALARATRSAALRAVCERLLADERAHVDYQAELIRFMLGDLGTALGWIASAAHRVLYAGAMMVVFYGHRRVLRAGGCSFTRYWRACWREFDARLGSSAHADLLAVHADAHSGSLLAWRHEEEISRSHRFLSVPPSSSADPRRPPSAR